MEEEKNTPRIRLDSKNEISSIDIMKHFSEWSAVIFTLVSMSLIIITARFNNYQFFCMILSNYLYVFWWSPTAQKLLEYYFPYEKNT